MDGSLLNLLIANDHILYGKGLGNAILKKAPNRFSINYTEDFESTLFFLSSNNIDLIILDFQMPKGDLIYTVTSIKEKWPTIRIILNGMLSKASLKYFPSILTELDGLLSFVSSEDVYINAIDKVMGGGLYFYLPH